MKVCVKCKKLKYLSEYHQSRNSKDNHIAICKKCVQEKYLLRYIPKKRNWVTHCKMCGVAASNTVVLVGHYCRTCKAEPTKKYKKRYNAKKNTETIDEDFTTYNQCITWIQLVNARGAWVNVKGLNDLITVYNFLGGKHQQLDLMSAGEQLYNMWQFCKQKLPNE